MAAKLSSAGLTASKPDFCEYCGAALNHRERSVTVYRHRRGRHFIFEQVPARVCPHCGERYISARVAGQMDRLMRARGSRARTVSVPVIPLRATGS
jgi:YgiT-type zinc finger domain-containing protein